MRRHAQRQLVLDLESAQANRPFERAPEGLVQALADLLLEAFGEEVKEKATGEGAADDS